MEEQVDVTPRSGKTNPTICSICARKATMVVRLDSKGEVLKEGSQLKVGGNDIYKVVCRKHFRKLTKLI